MNTLQEHNILVQKVCQIYDQISKLETLKPSKNVNTLFTELVHTCIPPSSINISNLPLNIQELRSKLIRLCGEAEGHLEAHYSTLLATFQNPIHHLHVFPYYNNYIKLSRIEYNILNQYYPAQDGHPKRIAFVGSGPLPLTSIVLASYHLKETTFHNYDIDPLANSMASRLVSPDPDLSKRIIFFTIDILNVRDELKDYDVVFLAALVGMDMNEKIKVVQHLAKYMAPGSILMLRSAHGARAFLYPVIDIKDLVGFEVLSVFHPDDDVINSVVISRKYPMTVYIDHKHHDHQLGVESIVPSSCKYCEFQMFKNSLNQRSMIEELAVDE
ncbi:nicotianamine synthase-like [Rutidosis leptorrhynchoides]|uniref:nicotianamine synthase-like n=1 Tax=Rutidosis leptorrhynchoides TaxID=125765 RepID=UPI003A99A473